MVDDSKHIVSFNAAFPKNFNKEFSKYMEGTSYAMYLSLGLWEFYPSNISVKNGIMSIETESGILVMGKYERTDYKKYFDNVVNKGACI